MSTACEAGVMTLINSGGLRVIAPQMSDLPDGNKLANCFSLFSGVHNAH